MVAVLSQQQAAATRARQLSQRNLLSAIAVLHWVHLLLITLRYTSFMGCRVPVDGEKKDTHGLAVGDNLNSNVLL